MTNDGEDTISSELCLLNPPINHDFSCAEFDIDETSDSDATISYNGISDKVTVLPLPPEPPKTYVPETTLNYTSKILKDLRSNPSTCYLGCNSLILGM